MGQPSFIQQRLGCPIKHWLSASFADLINASLANALATAELFGTYLLGPWLANRRRHGISTWPGRRAHCHPSRRSWRHDRLELLNFFVGWPEHDCLETFLPLPETRENHLGCRYTFVDYHRLYDAFYPTSLSNWSMLSPYRRCYTGHYRRTTTKPKQTSPNTKLRPHAQSLRECPETNDSVLSNHVNRQAPPPAHYAAVQ